MTKWVFAALLAGLLGWASPGVSADVAAAKPPVTEADLARLSDAELRAIVAEKLATPGPADSRNFNPADIAYSLQSDFGRIRERLGDIFGAYGGLPDAFRQAGNILFGDREEGGMALFLMAFIVALLGGFGCEFAVRRRIVRSGAVEIPSDLTLWLKLRALAGSLLRDGLFILLFSVVAIVIFFVIETGGSVDRIAFAFYLSAIVILRLVASFSRSFLGIRIPAMRITSFSNSEALAIHRGVLVSMALGAFGFFTCALFAVMGIHGDVHLLLLLMVGTVMMLGFSIVFVLGREALQRDLSGSAASSGRRRFARLYPWLMAAGIPVLWALLVGMATLGTTPLFGAGLSTIAILSVWPMFDAAAQRESHNLTGSGDDVTPSVLRVLRIAVAVGSLFILLTGWRFDLLGRTDAVASAVGRGLLEVGVVLLVAYSLWQILNVWANRKIAEEDASLISEGHDSSEMEIGGAGLSRMRTLLPLFRRAGQVTIAVIALMIILSSLGVNIAPVLAGAGVVGLAIGFGSQTLVRDIVSGAFFLMDDAFRLGEYVDLGDVKGSVERIATRSLQLRHHRGALHTVPFGEITRLSNYSRDWAIMKLRFRVNFDADLEQARKIIKKVGASLLEHPDVGEDFIQPFKSQGVVEVDDYGLIISTKFMCKPGKQFLIRRHAYAAVQKAFADNGISFARPEVRVSVDKGGDEKTAPGDEQMSDASAVAAATAIASAARQKQATETTGS